MYHMFIVLNMLNIKVNIIKVMEVNRRKTHKQRKTKMYEIEYIQIEPLGEISDM